MIDSGAGVHVCPFEYAKEYPINPVDNHLQLVNADGSPIKCYGGRWVKYEIIPGRTLWIRYLVCDVTNAIWSVSKFRRGQGSPKAKFDFGDDLKINFGDEYEVGFYEKGRITSSRQCELFRLTTDSRKTPTLSPTR